MSKKESFRTVTLTTSSRVTPAHVTSPKHRSNKSRSSQRQSRQRHARMKRLRAAGEKDLIIRSRRAMLWLLPGLVVKRWVLTSALGLLLALLGAAVWADLKPIYWIIETLTWLLGTITTVLPSSITGPLVIVIGAALVLWGQSRSFGSIQQALAPDKDTVLVDALRAKSKLNRGPNIVAIGGGTGLSTLLSGLKRYSSNITAIVTVADDGGSSGVLRR